MKLITIIIVLFIMFMLIFPLKTFSQKNNKNNMNTKEIKNQDENTSFNFIYGINIYFVFPSYYGSPLAISSLGLNYIIKEKASEWVITLVPVIIVPQIFTSNMLGLQLSVEKRYFLLNGNYKPYIGLGIPIVIPPMSIGTCINFGLINFDFGKSFVSSLEILSFGVGIGTSLSSFHNDDNKKAFQFECIINVNIWKLTF